MDSTSGGGTNANNSKLSGLVSIYFHLKQCTVFHHKFGCYAIDVRFSGQSRRSPTINILKERVKLDVQIELSDIAGEGEDLVVSLYNQTLLKGKQVDILVSQQPLRLSSFTVAQNPEQKQQQQQQQLPDQLMTFSTGSIQENNKQIIAEVKFSMRVNDQRGIKSTKPKRNFMAILIKALAEGFMPNLLEREARKAAEEERIAVAKAEADEIKRKKQEEDDKRKAEVIKRQEDLTAQRKAQQEKERKEKERIRDALEEKARQEEINAKLREEHLRSKRIEDEMKRKKKSAEMAAQIAEERQRRIAEIKKRQQLQQQGDEEQANHNNRINVSDILKPKKKKVAPVVKEQAKEIDIEFEESIINSNDDDDDDDLRFYEDDDFEDHTEEVKAAPPSRSSKQSSLHQPTTAAKSQLARRDFMGLFRKGLVGWLERIIVRVSSQWEAQMNASRSNAYSTRFWIFGDETHPFTMDIVPETREVRSSTIVGSLATYRYASAVGLPNGWIFLCGGVNSKLNNIVPFAQVFDPYANVAHPVASMHSARYTHSTTYYDGYVYAIGGRTYGTGEPSILNSFERFSLKSGQWERLAKINDARCTTTMIGLNGCIYLFGGYSPRGRLNSIEKYDIASNTWQAMDFRLPFEVEAGIVFSTQATSSSPSTIGSQLRRNNSSMNNDASGIGHNESFRARKASSLNSDDQSGGANDVYFMYGRTNKEKNSAILRISLVESPSNIYNSSEQDPRITIVGRVRKTRVLPGFSLIDDRSRLFVIGGEDQNECEIFNVSSFEVEDTWKTDASIIPTDLKMFCSALSTRSASAGSVSKTIKVIKWTAPSTNAMTTTTTASKKNSKDLSGNKSATGGTATVEIWKCPTAANSIDLSQSFEGIRSESGVNSFGMIKALVDSNQLICFGGGSTYSRDCFIVNLNSGLVRQCEPCLFPAVNSIAFVHGSRFVYSFGVSLNMRYHVLSNQWEQLCEYPRDYSTTGSISGGAGGGFALAFDGCIVLLNQKSRVVLFYEINLNRFRENREYPNLPLEIASSWKYAIQFKPKRGSAQSKGGQSTMNRFVGLLSESFVLLGVLDLMTGNVKVGGDAKLKESMPVVNSNDAVVLTQNEEFVIYTFADKVQLYRAEVTTAPSGLKEQQTSFQLGMVAVKTYEMFDADAKPQSQIEAVFVSRREESDFACLNRLQIAKQRRQSESASRIFVFSESLQQQSSADSNQKRLVSMEVPTGKERIIDTAWMRQNLDLPSNAAYAFDSRSKKIYVTGGVSYEITSNLESNAEQTTISPGASALSSIIELDLSKKQSNRLPDMITPRWGHSSIIVGKYLYMIGGFASTMTLNANKLGYQSEVVSNFAKKIVPNQSSKNEQQRSSSSNNIHMKSSPMISNNNPKVLGSSNKILSNNANNSSAITLNKRSQESVDRLDKIAATRNANSQVVIAIQAELANRKSTQQSNSSFVVAAAAAGSMKSIPNIQGKGRSSIVLMNQANGTSGGGGGVKTMNAIDILKSKSQQLLVSSKAYVLKKIDRVNLVTREVESVADMLVGVANAASCDVHGECIYVIGGASSLTSGVFASYSLPFQKYDIATNAWLLQSELRLPTPLHSVTCLAVSTTSILIFGGLNKNGNPSLDVLTADLMAGLHSGNNNVNTRVRKIGELILPHVSQRALVESAQRVLLIDDSHVQCITNIGDCLDVNSSEINRLNVKQVAGIIQSNANASRTTSDSESISSEIVLCAGFMKKEAVKNEGQLLGNNTNESMVESLMQSRVKSESLIVLGNERNRVGVILNLRSLKAKVFDVGSQVQLCSSSSSAYSEDDNEVILSGGIDFDSAVISSSVQFVKSNNSSSLRGAVELIIPRFLHASVVWKNKLYVIGGKIAIAQSNGSSSSLNNSMVVVDNYNNTSMNGNTSNIVVGNNNNSGYSQPTRTGCTGECEVLDLKSGKQSKIAKLNVARSNIQAIVLAGKIHVFGGFGGDKRLRSIERFEGEGVAEISGAAGIAEGENESNRSAGGVWRMIDCYMPNDLEGYSVVGISKVEAVVVGGKDNGHPSAKMFVFNAAIESVFVLRANLGSNPPFPIKCATTLRPDEILVLGIQKNSQAVERPVTMLINIKDGTIDLNAVQNVPSQAALDISWTATLTTKQF